MKTIFTNFKFIAVTICLLLTGILVNAQRYAVANGNWNATATWSTTNGGAPGAAVPTSTDNVFISVSRTVTVVSASLCNNLTVDGTLNVTGGNITITDNRFISINSGASVIFSATNIINGGSNGSGGILVTINSGASLTTANALGFNTGIGNNNVYPGSINVNNGNSANASYSTTANYTFNAAGAQSTGTGITGAANLTIAGSGAKTLSVATSVSGILSMQGTSTLTNAPTYGGSAILEYAGSVAQTTGPEFPATLSNLIINNASGVSLNAAKAISGQLTLTNGILTTTTFLLTLNTGSSASFTPGSATSFINGPMAKVGITAFVFPVGKSGVGMRRIGIGAPSVSSTFTAEFNRAAGTGSGIQGGQPANPLKQVSICEHWILNRTGSGDAAVTLSWGSNSECNGALYVTSVSDLRVARWTGAAWVNEGNASNTGGNTAGTITSGTVTSFSPFALASSSSATNPLPVKFSDVKAFEKQNGVQIEWTNLTESDLVNYIVERSVNGIDFTTINQLAPRSNMSNKEMYNSFDASPVSGANFYRIKAIELDGKTIYSQLLKVMIGEKLSVIKLFPNPVSGNQITLGFMAASGQYRMQVINGIGQQILTQTINHQGGTLSQSIVLPETVKAGIYKLVIQGNNYKESKTFIVQ